MRNLLVRLGNLGKCKIKNLDHFHGARFFDFKSIKLISGLPLKKDCRCRFGLQLRLHLVGRVR